MTGLRVGFACVWEADAPRTWSYTPWDLREALRRQASPGHESGPEIVDLGITPPLPVRRAMQLATLRRRGGRFVTPWEHWRPWEWASEQYLSLRADRSACDVVLEIQDLASTRRPYFLYQDLSYDIVADLLDDDSAGLAEYFPHLERSGVERRRARQVRIYEAAAGIFAMSQFLATSLVERTGIDPAKVHVVRPGARPSPMDPGPPAPRRPGARRRLLFVGTTFGVKGGDLVVAATEILRREHDADITLTVVGPDRWPLGGGIPEGVRFLGRVGATEMDAIYASHDVLVVPSRLEGFGKVFVEALAHGLPCVGRNAFAMPEIIEPGRNGALVDGEDPVDLADGVWRTLQDEAVFERCAADRGEVLRTYNWDRAATDMLTLMGQGTRRRTAGASR